MSLVAAGVFALPLNYAAATLAASATFQGLVGVSDAASALSRIFLGETNESDPSDGRPRAMLDIAGDFGFDKVSTTGFLGKGSIELVIEVPTPPNYQGADDRREARTWAYNWIGSIIAEMQALAGQPGYLNIIEFEEKNSGRADPKENNGEDFWVTVWKLGWLG